MQLFIIYEGGHVHVCLTAADAFQQSPESVLQCSSAHGPSQKTWLVSMSSRPKQVPPSKKDTATFAQLAGKANDERSARSLGISPSAWVRRCHGLWTKHRRGVQIQRMFQFQSREQRRKPRFQLFTVISELLTISGSFRQQQNRPNTRTLRAAKCHSKSFLV